MLTLGCRSFYILLSAFNLGMLFYLYNEWPVRFFQCFFFVKLDVNYVTFVFFKSVIGSNFDLGTKFSSVHEFQLSTEEQERLPAFQ